MSYIPVVPITTTDMSIYLTLQAKRDVEKNCFEMRTVTKSNHERDFFSFMSKRRKYADVLLVLAENRSIFHMSCT